MKDSLIIWVKIPAEHIKHYGNLTDAWISLRPFSQDYKSVFLVYKMHGQIHCEHKGKCNPLWKNIKRKNQGFGYSSLIK